MAICGSKTRSGQPCQSKAMSNGRCRMHGGTNKGAPVANQNSKKAGSLYSAFFTPEECEIAENLELNKIDDELRLTKIRLIRALKLEAEQAGRLELEARTINTEQYGEDEDEDDSLKKTQESFKRRDYHGLINTLTARIQSLTTQRGQLVSHALDAEIKALERDKLARDAGKGDAPAMGEDYRLPLTPDEDAPSDPIL